jgi:ribonuclease G
VSTEILVNIAQNETRVALVEGGAVQEVFLQRASRHGLVGNIYKGIVRRVLPGMQAAFVEIGLERTAFLHAADMQRPANGGEFADTGPVVSIEVPPIDQLLSEGQDVLVQVLKDPLGSKGARLTTLLSVPSRYLVLLPYDRHVGVSARIEDEAERARLKALVAPLVRERAPDFGVIVRTAGEGADAQALATDLDFLLRLWETVSARAGEARPGTLVQGDRRVDLKSGGHLVIDQTEAMTTIDVNTGAFTGHKNLEETILKTNLEAAQAIARQLRLRNLGGIIILDFIDMRNEAHRAQVLRTLEKELKRDPARTAIHPFSELGLVEMTRKRTRESLGHILCEPCPACEGRGSVKSVETVCNEIMRDITRSARQFEAKAFLVIAAPGVIARLADEQPQALAEIEELLRRPIRLQAEPQYLQDAYDVVPL